MLIEVKLTVVVRADNLAKGAEKIQNLVETDKVNNVAYVESIDKVTMRKDQR